MRALKALAAGLIAALIAGCGQMQYSADPEKAQAQKWAQACAQMGQSIQTAIMLYQSGNLTPAEVAVVDRIDRIYRPVCTGDPGPLDELLKDTAARIAVSELCPELGTGPSDEILVTVTQAAACAARQALLLQLEDSS